MYEPGVGRLSVAFDGQRIIAGDVYMSVIDGSLLHVCIYMCMESSASWSNNALLPSMGFPMKRNR